MMLDTVKGKVADVETGESFEREHLMFCYEAEMNSIVRIEHVDNYTHQDNSIQISIDCLALDCVGFVFDMNLDFTPETESERSRILNDLKVSSVFLISGRYGTPRDAPMTLYDPQYQPPAPELEMDAQEVFRVNGMRKKQKNNDQ